MPPEDSPTPDRFAGTDPDPVPDGGILNVKYTDPEKGGQTIEARATNGDDATESSAVPVKLRGNGKGMTQFIVPPGWGSVVLTADGSADHTVDVAMPP